MKLRRVLPWVILAAAFFCASSTHLWAQAIRLQAFAPLIGGRWQATGEWANGAVFEQEIEFRWALGQTIVLAESFGIINPETSERGHRNHGIRSWNATENKLRFWEFDVFGGLTKGDLAIDGQNITLIYQYGQDDKRVKLHDRWTRVNDQTYDFTVEQFEHGKWTRLLSTQFRRTK